MTDERIKAWRFGAMCATAGHGAAAVKKALRAYRHYDHDLMNAAKAGYEFAVSMRELSEVETLFRNMRAADPTFMREIKPEEYFK